jgi:predicted trehalose synthase
VLERAIDLPGAPRYLRRLVARLKSEAGGLETAEAFLHGLLLEAEDGSLREQYEKALLEIATERVARRLDEARERYRERHGHDVESVEDLVRGASPVLAALPPDPSGGRWIIDRYTGELVSDAVRHRYEAKIDAVNRKRVERVRSRGNGNGEKSGG